MRAWRIALRGYSYAANVVSWAVFALVGVLLNVACMPLLLAPRRERFGSAVRATIRWLFTAWCAWMHAARMVYVLFHGFTPAAMAGPAVYIANHPGILDATFILSRLPDAICIFKPAIMRNPVLGPAALLAGYASGDSGVDLIRDVANRLKAGSSLLVFPEGTRTAPNVTLNPLKPGFALIASRARVPVRLVLIRAPRDLVPKGWPWWRPPSNCPVKVEVSLVGEIQPQPGESAGQLTERVRRQLSAALDSA